MVQEFKLEGYLLFPVPIQNFDQLIILFEIDYLSGFNLISEGFEKYLIFLSLKIKPSRHTLPSLWAV